MYKAIAIVTSLLNATVMGVLAYRVKEPKIKAWNLSKMDWMTKYQWVVPSNARGSIEIKLETVTWPRTVPKTKKIAEALMTLDVYLSLVEHFRLNKARDYKGDYLLKVIQAVSDLQEPITDKLALLDETIERRLSGFFKKVKAGIDGTDTVSEALTWILIRGASCLPEFGTPENWGAFETRVKIVLGRSRARDQTNSSLFSMASRNTFVNSVSTKLGLTRQQDAEDNDVLSEYGDLFRDTDPPEISDD